jgi:predicted enzyme related to lactoylglutathione lyase
MIEPSYFLLYVADVGRSADFYASLLDRKPVEQSPGFAMFVLTSKVKLGLWARHTVEPAVAESGTGGELAIWMEERESVDSLYRQWSARGLPIAQQPTEMDFGYTFVALDPDGHRLRVFA